MTTEHHYHLKKLTVSAMMLAIALLLPFLTGQLPAIGNMLSPMHIPVLLTGMLCGPIFGFAVGVVAALCASFCSACRVCPTFSI
jgi:uncharacterized membrane protein